MNTPEDPVQPPDGEALVRRDGACTPPVVDLARELDRQRRCLSLALEHIPGYGVVMLDGAGVVDDRNPSLGRLLGLPAEAMVGQPLLRFVAAETVEAAKADSLRDALASQSGCQFQAPWQHADGSVLWGDCRTVPLVEPDGSTSGFAVVIRDVTDEHRRQQLEEEALTDPLTGLSTQRGLEQRAVMSAGPGFAIGADVGAPAEPGQPKAPTAPTASPAWILLDIDHLQRVNDTYGHDGGDAVLKAVAAALQGAARDGDTLARLGSEEFVLHLPSASDVIARRVAERLRLHLQATPIDAGRHKVHITASFGVALQGPGESGTQALERAKVALHRAKNGGRNRVLMATAAPAATTGLNG